MKKYQFYKPSNIQWIGDVPENWNFGKMKYILSNNDGGVWGNDIEDEEIGTIVIRSTEITIDGNWDLSNPIRRTLSENEISKSKLFEGDIVITKSSGSPQHIGKSVIVNKEIELLNCCYSNFVQRIRFKEYNPKLYHYVLNSNVCRSQFKFLTTSSTGLGNLNGSSLNDILLPFIPLDEQEQIVKYLDKKTTIIDKLLFTKVKKIELLKEKRLTLINQVITKGLKPVKMKDSGVEWIGEIPEHWEMKKLKYIFQIQKRISGELGHDVLSITQKGIKLKDIESGKGQVSMDYSKYQIVEIGDFGMNHMDLLTGYIDISPYKGVTSPDYRVFTKTDEKSNSNYYLYLFQFGYTNKVFYGFGQGSSMFGRWRLPSSEFNNFKIPYPSLEEQNEIVSYLDTQMKEIDDLVSMEQKKIDLLKEYRQSLISEVITGKIKVIE